jgi:AraC-like DNA-binding protein
MSRARFLFHFARLTGSTFGQFGIRHRVHAAAADLRSSSEPIKAIARDWGFTDESHLYKAFRKHYGCTPHQFREGFPGGNLP